LKPLLKIYTNDLWLYEHAGTNFANHTPFKHHETEFSLQPAERDKILWKIKGAKCLWFWCTYSISVL